VHVMRAQHVLALALACVPAIAGAQTPPPQPQPAKPLPTPEDAARSDALDKQQSQVDQVQQQVDGLTEKVDKVLMPLAGFITIYVDLGAFAVSGNGSGIRSDYGNFYYPKYANKIPGEWVFMGDPLSTAINALGEPADAGNSRELREDDLKSHGHPSVLVNSVGLAIGREVYPGISIATLAELLPRPDGDKLDVELAHLDWKPFDDQNFWISAGKIDSVLGVEYRSQDAPRRLTVTPSEICRYTCGRQYGIEARLVSGRLSASGAVTDGDSFMSRFEPATSIHSTWLPTASGHLQWMLPVGQGLELGVSGAIGPQDKQPDIGIAQWHVGFDARLVDLDGFDAVAEYVQGLQQGKTTMTTPCNVAPCLSYKGAYLLVDRRVNSWLTPYVRLDWRDAVHTNGGTNMFVYESHVWRATFGLHLELTNRILAKVEYTFNRELDNIPQFPDDIFTSSIVVATE